MKKHNQQYCCAAFKDEVENVTFFYTGVWKISYPGAVLLEEINFCPFCGKKLEYEEETT